MLHLRRMVARPARTLFVRTLSDGAKPAVNPETPFAADSTDSPKPAEAAGTSAPAFVDPKPEVDISNVYVKVGQVESIPDAVFKAAAPFDDVPGPAFLKTLARLWTYIPIVGTQVTASTVQYLLSAGKLFGSQLSWGNNLWLFKWLLDEYGPVVRLHGPFGGDVVIVSRPEHASMVFQNEGPYPIRSTLDCVEKYRLQYRKYKQAGPFLM